jgi:CheY-like chemotaxis protein/HPt (histidine-containing phosphotransfer) domain-containing protein
LVVELPESLPVGLHGDPLRLTQILTNLGNNAVKFADSGRIVFGVEEASREGGRIELHFWVKDDGIGLSAEQQSRLFQSFTQADASTTRKYGGTGLGLAICKQLVELMGGRIWIDSVPDQGATFHFHAWFDVPENQAVFATPADDKVPVALPEAKAKVKGARVLLVEDNEMNRDLAVELLGQAGMDVIHAENGQQAVDLLLTDSDFDGILMDCQMPVMDGYEATRAIRTLDNFKTLPIIAMTANAMVGDREKALAAGMNDHIAKPLNVGQMFEVLARWITPAVGRVAKVGAGGTAITATDATFHIPGVDTQAGLAICVGNTALYDKMLTGFVAGQSSFAEEFAAAFAAGDLNTATRYAHTLKSTAGNIGAKEVQSCAAKLEHLCRTNASASDIRDSLEATIASLMPVIAAIEAFRSRSLTPSASDSAPRPMRNATPAELNQRLVTLRALLSNSEAEAPLRLDELLALAQGMPQQEALSEATKALLGYDFDAALSSIESVNF